MCRHIPWLQLTSLIDVIMPVFECLLKFSVEKQYIKLFTYVVAQMCTIGQQHPRYFSDVIGAISSTGWLGIRSCVPVLTMMPLGDFSLENLGILTAMILLIKDPITAYAKKPMQDRHSVRVEFVQYLLGKRKAIADVYKSVTSVRDANNNAVFPTLTLLANIARQCLSHGDSAIWLSRFIIEELLFLQGIFMPDLESTLVPRPGEPDVRHPSCVGPLRTETTDQLVSICNEFSDAISMIIYAMAMHNGRLQSSLIEPLLNKITYDRYKLSAQSLDLLCFLLAGRQGPRASSLSSATGNEMTVVASLIRC